MLILGRLVQFVKGEEVVTRDLLGVFESFLKMVRRFSFICWKWLTYHTLTPIRLYLVTLHLSRYYPGRIFLFITCRLAFCLPADLQTRVHSHARLWRD